jgi:hypothetical protein
MVKRLLVAFLPFAEKNKSLDSHVKKLHSAQSRAKVSD